MKKLPFFLLLILLLEVTTTSVESQSPALLKYVLQWPPTFCIKLDSEFEEGRCKEPVPEHEFTLHGLMPADEEGFSIGCDPGEDPNWDELFEPIEDELVTFWPSLREDFNETELWKHEWRAHGACGGTTPEEYFHTAISINYLPENGNLFNYLETNGIIPSDSLAYQKQNIVEAVQNVFDETHFLLIRKPTSRALVESLDDISPRRRSPPPPRRSPPPPRRSPPPPRRSPPPPRRSPPPPPRRSPPPPPRRSPPPPPRRSPPPPPRRSPPPPPRRSPPPPPRRSPPPPPPRRSPPPPPRRSPPPPPPRSPPPPPPRLSPPPPPPRSPPPPPPPSPSPPPPPPSPSPPPPPFVPPPPEPPRNIYLSCIPIYPENTTHVYLSEVTLCTNLDGTEYISCPPEADPASCPDEALIMLPLPQPQWPTVLPLDI